MLCTVTLIDSAICKKVFAFRPWKLAQTTGLLKTELQNELYNVVYTDFDWGMAILILYNFVQQKITYLVSFYNFNFGNKKGVF